MSLFDELKRRNVFRIAAAYLVVGWLLTEVFTTILPAFGAPEWISKAIMLIFALGFIPAIILAWAYELTPDGIKKDRDIDRESPVQPSRGRRLEYVTIVSVILGIVFISVFSSRLDIDNSAPGTSPISNSSVAVLPFLNMSGDEDNAYFSDGLTETLLHMLAQVPDLKVAARTSSFAFRGQNKTIVEIAKALEVAHVLEGSVQRAGDRVRITAQLIRADDGFHVWSKTYDRTLDDIFAIQDEIALEVGSALSKSLLGRTDISLAARAMTSDPDAYDLYLQAQQARSTFSYGGLKAAEELLKGALTIDPDFIDAKTSLAYVYLHQFETGLLDLQSANSEIEAITDQVLEIRPDDIDAQAIRFFAATAARAELEGPQIFIGALAEFERIVAAERATLQPKILLTHFYKGTQQFDKAVQVMNDALRRDPFNPRIHYELGSLYMALEQPENARAALQKSLDIEPNQPNAYANLAGLSMREGDGLEYVQQFLKAIAVDPVDHELSGIVAMFLYELGLIDEADDFRKRVMAIAPTSEISYRLELLRAINLGDEEASIISARRAIEDDIDERRFAYAGAVQHLLRIAASRGTVEQEFEYLEAHAPNILDIELMTAPLKYRLAQYTAFDAWYISLPREELLRRLDRTIELAKTFGLNPSDNPATQVGILVLRDNIDEAVEVALADYFSESVAMHLDWRRTFSQAQYAEFVATPSIANAMKRWEEEEASLRSQVKTYLADLSAAT